MKFQGPPNVSVTLPGGKSYSAGDDGVIDVPDKLCTDAAIADLASHGVRHHTETFKIDADARARLIARAKELGATDEQLAPMATADIAEAVEKIEGERKASEGPTGRPKGEKSPVNLDKMDRAELIAFSKSIGMHDTPPKDMTDNEIRTAIQHNIDQHKAGKPNA